MSLRIQYLFLIILLHGTTLVLSFLIFEENKIFFIASELVILSSLFFSIRLYQSLVNPLNLILTGIEAIKDQDFNIKFLETGKMEMDQLINVYNKMIDQLRKERRAQEEQHYFLDNLIQNSPTGILVLDYDGKIERINPRAMNIFKLKASEIQGKQLHEIAHPLSQKLIEIPLEKAKTFIINGMLSYKCHRSQFIDRGFYRQFIMIEELTEEILMTEKKAYGKVIRMMAHEVNNSIGPINTILKSLLFFKPQIDSAEQSEYEKVITVAQERNERLNKFMKNFAHVVRLPEPHLEQKDICQLLKNTAQFLTLEAKKNHITIEYDLPENPVVYAIDIYQMEQVLLNIMTNAMEAIKASGQIKVSLAINPIRITIKNNGEPIAKENESKLFSPFFSTKKEGQGIGLTLTREILHNHGFSFALMTKDDGWTYFEITLSPASLS